MVRVVNIQESEATTSAITLGRHAVRTIAGDDRPGWRCAGTVISASATTRMAASTGPPKLPASEAEDQADDRRR